MTYKRTFKLFVWKKVNEVFPISKQNSAYMSSLIIVLSPYSKHDDNIPFGKFYSILL